ncbi:MAG: hypothetical protein IJM30_07005 [Thermoguttaceae bacterium]|nr:hypothetical protein [Thermoguttaceae bacterium]
MSTSISKRARSREPNAAMKVAVGALLFVALGSFAGCDSLKDHKCCLFKPGGIFAEDERKEVERVSSSEEKDIVARAASAARQKKEAWEPTDSELRYAKDAGIDLRDYAWSTQRPNGGVLFPTELKKRGPAVVVAPETICAPTGTDIILVASYIDSDNEHLTVGEKLSWEISGVGSFTSTNPKNSTRILQCPWSPTSHSVEGRSQTTETSGQLYRITRGTKSTEDDVAILRGQSWTSVLSYEEGTSTVVVGSSEVPEWTNRRAEAQIHWIDAAFRYPESSVGPIDRPGSLETIVRRRSNAEPRADWPVRYEVLSGEGGFDSGGGTLRRAVTIPTDANGRASVLLGQNGSRAGTTKVKVSIYRPGTADARETVVDSRTINYTWTTAAPVGIQMIAPPTAAVGAEVRYQIVINNFSDFAQNVDVSVDIPLGGRFVSIDPPIGNQTDPQRQLKWRVEHLAARGSLTFDLILRKERDGDLDLRATIIKAEPSSGASSAPAANQGSGTTPPVEGGR